MSTAGFIFDIIVVQIDTPNHNLQDPSLLTVDVDFNSVSLKITSSRINVCDFRSGSSYEFSSNPDELRSDLRNEPMRMQLIYDGEVIGSGHMCWPDHVLDQISVGMGELNHVDQCDLQNNDEKVGSLEVIVRLQCKCQEMDESEFKEGDDIRKHLDKVINPHDILFVVGQKHQEDDADDDCINGLVMPGNECADQEEPTALDLSRYRGMNGQRVKSPDILNTCVNMDCCELKNAANQYQDILDKIEKRMPKQQHARGSCSANVHCTDCPNEATSSSSPQPSSTMSSDIGCFAAKHSEENEFRGQKLTQTGPPDLNQTIFHVPRKCPVCNSDNGWLPKLAACPKCGFKPMPISEEKPYNTSLTADQILQEYLDKQQTSSSQCNEDRNEAGQSNDKKETNDQKKDCRCTCKPGKICAHCRIRKLCADVFTTNSQTKRPDDCGKCESKSSDLYNVCKTSSKDCRPYLARVFSELRDLYEIKEPKKKGFEIDPMCERELNGGKMSQERSRRVSGMASNPITKITTNNKNVSNANGTGAQNKNSRKTKTERRPISQCNHSLILTKSTKKKQSKGKKSIYNYRAVRKDPCPPTGHKTCVNGFGGRKNVPKNMGWLWTADACGTRRGWKPGAIRKPIKEMMKFFLKDFPADTIRVSQYSYRNQGKSEVPPEEEELVQKPTLHICKKNDEYFVTLRPLKDSESLKHCADPYLKMKPIQFKITKNPLVVEMRKMKTCLKDMGFNKCTCHKPILECYCRSFLDKKRLEYQVAKQCRKRKIPCCAETLVLSDTSESDVEFDFGVTPPAGVIKPHLRHKPHLVNHGTQYLESDWHSVPKFPRPPNIYLKHYDCATGDRYGYAGGYGGSGGGYVGSDGQWVEGGGGGGRGRGGRGGGRGGPGGRGGAGGRGWPVGRGGPGGRGGAAAGGPGGRGGAAGGGPGGAGGRATGGQVDMMKYMKSKDAARGSKGGKGGTGDAVDERKAKRRALGEIPPALLCTVDRRGKPMDPCCEMDPCCPARFPRIC